MCVGSFPDYTDLASLRDGVVTSTLTSMVLTIRTTHTPATDLGYLLHKNPDRGHEVELAFGTASVVYPEAGEKACTAALIVDVDPVALVRGKVGGEGGLLRQYVNDRPYVASSLLGTAMSKVYGTAMSGRCKERPELADQALPFEAEVGVVSCRGGEATIRMFFEPLGYKVEAEALPLDPQFPEWGETSVFKVKLSASVRLADLLGHLYVLLPALDRSKHYWVGVDEVEKLLRKGKGWLETHPYKNVITRRYLKYQEKLARLAIARLSEEEGVQDPEESVEEQLEVREKTVRLHDARLNAVLAVLKESGARRVLDLGCGEGRLLALLMREGQFDEVVGMDVSVMELDRAKSRLRMDRMSPKAAERIKLLHGSLLYADKRLQGFDAAAVVEVIEHLDPPRLRAFEQSVFGFAKPRLIAVTTPNKEYNALYEGMEADAMRHIDHRFEWTRYEFEDWATKIADEHGYTVTFSPIGPVDPTHGAPSQMGVFRFGN